MDRNTIYAILLSVIFIGAVLFITDLTGPKKKTEAVQKEGDKKVSVKEDKTKSPQPKKDTEKTKTNDEKITNTPKEKTTEFVGNIHPTDDYNASDIKDISKVKSFQVKTGVFTFHFTPLNAGINNAKLNHYKDEKGNLVDAIYNQNDKKVIPLSTSFVNAENLEKERRKKTLYRYVVYNYDDKTGELAVANPGTLGQAGKDHVDVIKKNIEKLKKDYGYKDKLKEKMTIVLFFAEFEVRSSGKIKQIDMYKIFSFKENEYLFDVNTNIISRSDGVTVLQGNDPGNTNALFYIHWGKSVGPHYVKDKSTYDDVIQTSYLSSGVTAESKEEIVEKSGTVDTGFKWLSMDSRYLMVAMVPGWNVKNKLMVWDKKDYFADFITGETAKKQNGEVMGIGYKKDIIDKQNELKNYHMSVLISPKTRAMLKQNHFETFNFIEIRNRTFFIIRPLEWAVEWLIFLFHGWVPNFGVAIIFLTIVLKILLHPLTKKSLESSRKMSELQPKLKEIEAKHKKNPQQKQKAIMEMYKKEGVNPLGGCLPLILQMPVFFALWNVLPSLLELKNADFLWIHDLSSPDTVAHINLGLTNSLNILPLIMTATAVFQMRLSPQPSMGGDDKAQTAKMMQYMMPVIFLFIFWTMPSGLVLYWTVQNTLQIGQQLFTNYMGKRKKQVIQ
ncbi:MAG: membrane protein insertase YidC [Spirochaetota bacterium]|nr:membrane protein insertase YidC [Spirochaetota bacterium]